MAACCGAATAWITVLSASSCPPFSTALSKAMPSADCSSPLPRAFASVTWPSSFDPFAITTLPSDFTSLAALATTSSPCFAFLASTGLVRTASIVVPVAISAEALVLPAFAFACALPLLAAPAWVLRPFAPSCCPAACVASSAPAAVASPLACAPGFCALTLLDADPCVCALPRVCAMARHASNATTTPVANIFFMRVLLSQGREGRRVLRAESRPYCYQSEIWPV